MKDLADALAPLFKDDLVTGATLLYWVTVPIVGVVEHDAFILTFLYMIRDLGAQGVDPWPLVVDARVVRNPGQQSDDCRAHRLLRRIELSASVRRSVRCP